MNNGEIMPSILLINDNKIVSRLLQLSSQKHDYKLEEINDYTPNESAYNVIFVDSEKYDEEALEALKSTVTYDKLGFMGDKSKAAPEGFDFVLEKPFLPTDFVTLMNENFKMVDLEDMPDELEVMEDVTGESEEELDLENLEEMEEIVDLEEEINLDDESFKEDEKSGIEPETLLTTGIASNLIEDESKEELADIVNEIDDMEIEEEVLEEMDLDELVDESEVASVVDEEMVKESLEEVEEELNSELEEVVEESEKVDATIAAGVASAAAATLATVVAKSDDVQEELEETLNILDGVEGIEAEDDYLKESEHKVEDLAGEFDSLNEEEVEKLMAGEEVISEEFSTGEEKVVESNDLEEMITRAVAKAITKEMLQEALKDMEITVKLQAKSKDS